MNEDKVFRENGISEYSTYTETYNDTIPANDESGYIVYTTTEKVAALKEFDFVAMCARSSLPRISVSPRFIHLRRCSSGTAITTAPLRYPRKALLYR